MSMDENLREECLRYFRERPVFGKLLCGFQEKYLSYGRFAGTVTLKNLKESDREDLEGFLLRNYHGKKSASVSAESFEKALEGSRFAGISGKDMLELYFQGLWREERNRDSGRTDSGRRFLTVQKKGRAHWLCGGSMRSVRRRAAFCHI